MTNTKNAKPFIGFVAALGILGVLFAMGILPRLQKNKELESGAKEAANAPTPVQFITPHPGPASNELLLPGSMQALEEATVYGRASGYVRERFVDIGSKVKKGQLLATIETPEVDQQLTQAQADEAKAQADEAKAQATIGQSQADETRLRVGVLQAQSEVHRFEAALRQAQAAQKRAEAHIIQTKALYANAQAKVQQTREAADQRKANLAQATSNLNIAQKTLTRWNQLVKSGAVAQQDVDERQATVEARQADVSAAQAAIRSAQADIDAAQAGADSAKSDIEAAQDDLEAAKSTVRGAQSALRSSQINIDATRSSVQAGVANTAASRANARSSAASARSSAANVGRVNTLKQYQRVVAPFDGIITARNVDTGSLVKADNDNGTASSVGLFKIARADTLRIQVSVPQTYFASIRDGQPAQVLVRELPGQVFSGTVKRNAGALSDASRTLLTEILLPNKDNALLPGMYAQVKFTIGAASKSALRIPASALISNADGLQVASIDANNTVHLLKIVVARDYGAELDIASGLVGNERLIINPSDSLQEGSKVTATAAPPPPPPPGK